MIKVATIIFDNCLSYSALIPSDFFAMANSISENKEPNLFESQIVSISDTPVTSSNGTRILPQQNLNWAQNADIIVIPGFNFTGDLQHSIGHQAYNQIIATLRQAYENGAYICAICTGTVLLAESSLLNGKKATTTWWVRQQLTKAHPSVDFSTDAILHEVGRIITSAAGSSAFDLSLYLIKKFASAEIADQCAQLALIEQNQRSQISFISSWNNISKDPIIAEAEKWVNELVQQQAITVEKLANHLGMSTRNLQRYFNDKIAITPKNFIQNIRMNHGKTMLEYSKLSVAEIADKLGFSDENAFRRSFQKIHRLTPSEYRKQASKFEN